MRPIELVAEGFGPFRDRVTIDFTDADFFALVGPTGAGKSSVIDAICFALYGIVPRYDDRRLVAPALTTGVTQARIQFTFEVDGSRHTVTRVVRRTAQGASTKECRLERITPDGSEVLSGDAPSTNQRVQVLLGLTPEHFTRCVVLPQGEFAKFLHDKPAERQKLLVELLGLEVYARMASAARTRSSNAKAKADALDGQLESLAGATAQAEQEAEGQLDRYRALREDVTAAAASVTAARNAIQQEHRELAAQGSLLSSLLSIAVPDEVGLQAEQLVLATESVETAHRAAQEDEEAAQEAEARAAEAPDVGQLQKLLSKWEALAAESAKLPAARQALDGAEADSLTAGQAVQQTEDAVTTAEEAVRQAEREHAVIALGSTLVVGQECPVCLVPVARIPERQVPADLTSTRAALAALKRELIGLRDADRAANRTVERARARLNDVEARCATLEAELAGTADEAALNAQRAAVQQLHQDAVDLRKRATASKAELADRQAEHAALVAQQRKATGQYTRQRDAVSSLQPPQPTQDLAADWNELVAWAAGRILDVKQDIETQGRALRDQQEALQSIIAGLAERAQRLGLEAPTHSDYEAIAPVVVQAEAKAESLLQQIRSDREQATKMAEQQRDLRAQATVAITMGHLLSARGFESWVLAEALGELVTGASVTLRELSQGAYSLTLSEANEFMIIDHREADAIRPARTLSGGETFQASLALALALADQLGKFASGGASKLESIFLDEGFGTLDEDSLEVVAATLETLANGDRVVGLVTHVKELAARVPVRYEVRKTGRTAVVERTAS